MKAWISTNYIDCHRRDLRLLWQFAEPKGSEKCEEKFSAGFEYDLGNDFYFTINIPVASTM